MLAQSRTKKARRAAPLDSRALVVERAGGLAADAENTWRHDNIGRLTLFCYNYFEVDMLGRLERHGVLDIKQTHLRVLRNIDFAGTRVTEIAARTNVTKGAISQTLADCERLGYVVAAADATDARARLVSFTPRGLALMRTLRVVIADVEAQFEAAVGAGKYAELKELLLEVRTALATAPLA